LAATLGEDLLASLPKLDELLKPENYLGEAGETVETGLREWSDACAISYNRSI